MIVPSSENVYSDESEDEIEEIDIYRRKYQLLLERCEVLQQVMLSSYMYIINLSTHVYYLFLANICFLFLYHCTYIIILLKNILFCR